jgi:hypothetical protein
LTLIILIKSKTTKPLRFNDLVHDGKPNNKKGKGLLPKSDPRRGDGRDNTKIYFCPYNYGFVPFHLEWYKTME